MFLYNKYSFLYVLYTIVLLSIITQLSGSTGKKHVITDRKIFNATFFPGFHIYKQMPHPPSFGMGH